MNHNNCQTSSLLDGSISAGQGNRNNYGVFEKPCYECANRLNAAESIRLKAIKDKLFDFLHEAYIWNSVDEFARKALEIINKG